MIPRDHQPGQKQRSEPVRRDTASRLATRIRPLQIWRNAIQHRDQVRRRFARTLNNGSTRSWIVQKTLPPGRLLHCHIVTQFELIFQDRHRLVQPIPGPIQHLSRAILLQQSLMIVIKNTGRINFTLLIAFLQKQLGAVAEFVDPPCRRGFRGLPRLYVG